MIKFRPNLNSEIFIYEEKEDEKPKETPKPPEVKDEPLATKRYLSQEPEKPKEKQMFPVVSLNGQKSKWRINKEKEEKRIRDELKEKNTYHTSNPPKYTAKELKK